MAWAANFAAVRHGVTNGFSPLAYAAPRFVIAAILFLTLALRLERSLRVARRDMGAILVVAVVGIVVNQIASVYSLKLATASTVALLFGTAPIFVAVIGHLSGVESLSRRGWFAAALSAMGAALIALATADRLDGGVVGITLALVATACWAYYSVRIGPLMRAYSIYRLTAVITLVAAVVFLPVAAASLAAQDWGDVAPGAWVAFAYSTAMFTVTSLVWFAAVKHVGASHASLYVNLEPFLGALFAVVLLSEALGALEIAGGLVIGSAILISRRRHVEAPAPP